MSKHAAVLKQKGNELFKAGAMERASKLYAQAEKADQSNPVYPSNLSAALFEIGDYLGCVDAVVRASRLLKTDPAAKTDLVARLSNRLAKALSYGARSGTIQITEYCSRMNDIDELRGIAFRTANDVTKAALDGVWGEWEATKAEAQLFAEKREESLGALSRLPLFFKPLDHTKEFFPIGSDDLIDLTVGWGSSKDCPVNFQKLSIEQLGQVAFLFGGVGDARHVMSTLCGLSSTYSKLPEAKRGVFRAHLTLLDIHAATLARDLCIFLLLDQLNHTSDATAKTEIKATLMYIFCGAVMPPYCYDRLQALLKDLKVQITSPNPNLPAYIHVVSDTIPAVLDVLDFWLTSSKSTRKMLQAHQNMDVFDRPDMPSGSIMPGASPEFQKSLEATRAAKRQGIKMYLLNMSDAELAQTGLVASGESVTTARSNIRANIEKFVDILEKRTRGGNAYTREVNWYDITKVFLPPAESRGQHPGFNVAWTQVTGSGKITDSVKRKVVSHIENDWKPNITIFDRNYEDPEYFPGGDGYPDMRLNMFDTINQLHRWNERSRPGTQLAVDTLGWDVCSTFFDEVAAALDTLGTHLTLEFICGGLSEELAKMRFKGDTTRPPEFPRKYLRMWLSNVPDYTHGPLGTILYIVPNLQDDQQAAVASNSLLNTPVWKDDQEFVHTYTLLRIEELPRYLGCKVIDASAVNGHMVLGPSTLPRPLSELATRDELTTWLTRMLFNTFLPGRTKPPPCNVRLPHNLVAFFGLTIHLHRVGYPAHWLSEFLGRILSGRMVSNIVPFNAEYPIPVRCSTERVAPRPVRTDPWLVDFETIIATAYYAIPFPIAAILPNDFSNEAGDIAVWEAPVKQATRFMPNPFTFSSPFEPVTQLLFYRSDKMAAADVIGNMRGIFEGKPTPTPGTFFVLTAQEYVQYQTCVRFRLSRRRVERMRKEKWSMVAYRNDNGIQATLPVPVAKWKMLTPDVDEAAYWYALDELD
ncbi:hypothetical protein C8T65DRAFT_802334 [Cerioporus squamosus]|nr:hypothetical protein C8T65DRAFT_802334 [Cerioporus squamosus]